MNRISACLITYNEEHNLPRALASLAGVVDEIVIVDSGSIDRTEELAREHGAALYFREWSSYGEQKNFAAECAQNEWIFSMDADEELSSALQTSLLAWKKSEPKFPVYEVARKTWYLGAWINHSGWYPDFQRRLYNRDEARFSGIIHESVRFVGPPGRVHGAHFRGTRSESGEVRRVGSAANALGRQAAVANGYAVGCSVALVLHLHFTRRFSGWVSRRAYRQNGGAFGPTEIREPLKTNPKDYS